MKKSHAGLLLAFVFIARGTSFLFSKELMKSMSPMNILAIRFLLAFTVLSVIFNKRFHSFGKSSFKGGLILGVLYTVCMALEMYGLRLIDSGTCSLIENMAIIIVPLYVAALTRIPPKKKTILCALIAVAGVGFLSLSQSKTEGNALGITLTILAAFTYAACILATEKVSKNGDPVAIGIIQLGIMGLLSLLIAVPTGGLTFLTTSNQWLLMLILVLICSCFGFAFQPVGQKYISAEAAAILTVLNPLTASIMGIAVAGEEINASKIIGYILIIASLLIYNIKFKNKID
ncbi:MAG: EamA family transporter [Clostridia bacterium]|nr:EamA family transporter [Clostridia bacterium]